MLATLTSQSVSDANFSTHRETQVKARAKAKQGQAKARYHHGELREALIAATRKLVEERGAENFTLADACRVAGVTTAAPYRHFQGKQEILAKIAWGGFEKPKRGAREEVPPKGEGTLKGI